MLYGLAFQISASYFLMHHGRRGLSVLSSSSSKLGNLLLVASITKTLSESGTQNLNHSAIPLSESLVLQILQRKSLNHAEKMDFFRWCSIRPGYKHSAEAYSLMFRSIAGLEDEIHYLLTRMKEDGVVVDSSTFKLLLDAFIRSGKYDSALQFLDLVEKELGAIATSTCLSPTVYNSVLVALVKKDQVKLALSILFKLLENASSTGKEKLFLDSIACNQLFVALRKSDMREEFKNVFEKLRENKSFSLDTWGYNICIHAFGLWGGLDTCLNLFKEMKENFLGPDSCTYNTLVQALCSAGKVRDALIVYEELKGSGHEPDAFTYRILIQGCSKSYLLEEATRVFSEMEYNGYHPTTIVYNSLLDGYFKANRVNDACQLFEKMVREGVRASCWTHNILIDGLFRNNRAAAGYSLFRDLKKKGQFVDGVTYSIVVLNLCREGMIDEALRLVEEMEARGIVVDLVTITSLLIGIHRQGRWDWTDRIKKHIRDSNFLPYVIKWKADMESSIRNPQNNRRKDFTSMFPSKGNWTDIMNSVNDSVSSEGSAIEEEGSSDQWSSSPYMDRLANRVDSKKSSLLRSFSLSRGKRVEPKGMVGSFDIDMVNTYLSIFLSNGNLSLACKLFEIFTDMGVSPVSYTYNSLMSSFLKRGCFDELYNVLHEMGEKLCPSDIATYNLIIEGLGKIGRADLATSVLNMLMKDGGYLDIVMYNTLINALGKAGRFDQVNEMFEQMNSSGINPDVITFNTLIEVHSKAGQLKEAYKFLKKMLDAGCSPNHVTDTTLDFLERELEKVRYQKASIKLAKKG